MRYIPIHSRMISLSTMEDFPFLEDGFQKGIPHPEPLFEFIGSIDDKINRDSPVDQHAEFPDPVLAEMWRIFLDDEEIEITFRCIISPGSTSEKDDFFGFVFCDDLGTDILDFLLNIHGVLDFGAAL